MIFGAYVTVRYWCPNLIDTEQDVEPGEDWEEVGSQTIEEEGPLALSHHEEIVSIEWVPEEPPDDIA